MKVLLINPPMYDQRKYGKPFILPYGPPLGIAYLASILGKHGFDVKAIDMFDYSWDKVRQTLEEELPDVVGKIFTYCIWFVIPGILWILSFTRLREKEF